MEDLDIARACADLADDKKAENIRILDLRGLSPVTDWFVLCSALSAPQLRAVRDHIDDEMKARHGQRPLYKDGSYDSQWMILDYGNVMVHILTPEKRDYYCLEELWGDAPEIPLKEETAFDAPAEQRTAKPARKKPAAKKAATKKPAAKKTAKAAPRKKTR
ncbi:MAG: ribosome silencing factor [Verrucomicrobiaceae bacterium]|jgi:ribosome-associated protein|nr:ribosome silencing factor [Verrucomicrobiaceae bacterium]